jgi:hypothetical protein
MQVMTKKSNVKTIFTNKTHIEIWERGRMHNFKVFWITPLIPKHRESQIYT